jgi:adrenodoxin-NADP+ reductase
MGFQLAVRRGWKTLTQKVDIDRLWTSASPALLYRVAIVGSGPSGFYAAKYLLAQHPQTAVDMYEKLPFPFGLVRYGVAPDHPEVKTVINTFHEVAKQYGSSNGSNGTSGENSRFRFFGSVEVSDQSSSASLSLSLLAQHYSAVLLAYGAAAEHSLQLPDEDAEGVLSARRFVNWYNGHPDFQDLSLDLSEVRSVVIVGHGNVALDCARLLAKQPDTLQNTDITSNALAYLRQNNVKKITIIGRRGHGQSSFTIKELRELSKLSNISLHMRPEELKAGWTEASQEEARMTPSKKRILQLMDTIAKSRSCSSTDNESSSTHSSSVSHCKIVDGNYSTEPVDQSKRIVEIRFLLNPSELITSTDHLGLKRIEGLKVQHTMLQGEPFHQRAVVTERSEVLPCQLLLTSIGYRSLSISTHLPFDSKRHVVPNEFGRVIDKSRWYVTGWLKRGPSGIIGTNITDARETVQCIIDDIASNLLPIITADPIEQIKHVDAKAGEYLACHSISWKQYEKLNQIEEQRGAECNPPKPREKIVDRQEAKQLAKRKD